MDEPKGLFNRGYVSLLFTQFFGAANDNVLKQCLTFMIATGIWSGERGGLGEGGQAVPALCLTLPFIFLSGYAGQISDKYSKRRVMVWVKVAEIPIAVVALAGFYYGNLWVTIGAMLLLAVQSSFFGPAKYGVLPEIVAEERLSMANGVINMATNVAIIVGSLAAGPLSDLFHPTEVPDAPLTAPVLWAPGVALVGVALLGLIAVLPFPRISAVNPRLKFDWNPFTTYIESVRIMAQGPLLAVVLAWAGFYMVGMIAMLIVPEYQVILNISYTDTSKLLGILGVAIAIGSVITGWISGKQVRPWLIPVGASGMCVAFLLLGLLEPTYRSVQLLIFLAGFCAGFYIVPLQALIQILAPDDERGRIIGTSGAISFCFTSLGVVIYWIATNPCGIPANRVHLINAAVATLGTVFGVIWLKRIMNYRSVEGVQQTESLR
jgi:acyl-[acyl-carrier-protein]-phospholipid O-acyltransferase/long-chain-fatty-acid--[acyl-carrier-protein] ligase